MTQIEKWLYKLVQKNKFKIVFKFLKLRGEYLGGESNKQVIKGDKESNIIAHICIVTLSSYKYKNLMFTVIHHSFDDSLHIICNKL